MQQHDKEFFDAICAAAEKLAKERTHIRKFPTLEIAARGKAFALARTHLNSLRHNPAGYDEGTLKIVRDCVSDGLQIRGLLGPRAQQIVETYLDSLRQAADRYDAARQALIEGGPSRPARPARPPATAETKFLEAAAKIQWGERFPRRTAFTNAQSDVYEAFGKTRNAFTTMVHLWETVGRGDANKLLEAMRNCIAGAQTTRLFAANLDETTRTALDKYISDHRNAIADYNQAIGTAPLAPVAGPTRMLHPSSPAAEPQTYFTSQPSHPAQMPSQNLYQYTYPTTPYFAAPVPQYGYMTEQAAPRLLSSPPLNTMQPHYHTAPPLSPPPPPRVLSPPASPLSLALGSTHFPFTPPPPFLPPVPLSQASQNFPSGSSLPPPLHSQGPA